ncbi:hypothetical protein MtrunA17_Chr5g0421751 [Medicago truncatula]|uniref:Transmembrane protein n=1 Tax=Medicago truncatula TaxID=3880 RepID=A0A396HR00_MEDTR|nr:hypothetical protein MtrunA17_Chr5g0421751 [Medicago truncatula]
MNRSYMPLKTIYFNEQFNLCSLSFLEIKLYYLYINSIKLLIFIINYKLLCVLYNNKVTSK